MQKVQEEIVIGSGPFCLHCVISELFVSIQKHRGPMKLDEALGALAQVAADLLASAPLDRPEVLAHMKLHNDVMVKIYFEHKRAQAAEPQGSC